jgi:hypothetical protein
MRRLQAKGCKHTRTILLQILQFAAGDASGYNCQVLRRFPGGVAVGCVTTTASAAGAATARQCAAVSAQVLLEHPGVMKMFEYEDGHTLDLAAGKGDLDMVKFLIEKNMAVSPTSMAHAAHYNHTKIMKVMCFVGQLQPRLSSSTALRCTSCCWCGYIKVHRVTYAVLKVIPNQRQAMSAEQSSKSAVCCMLVHLKQLWHTDNRLVSTHNGTVQIRSYALLPDTKACITHARARLCTSLCT